MSNIENLVPPLELCKKIPAGEFEDTVLMWLEVETPPKKEWRVVNRTKTVDVCHNPKHPAPTLKEIMANTLTRGDSYFCAFHDGNGDENEQEWSIGDCEHDLYVKNGYEVRTRKYWL